MDPQWVIGIAGEIRAGKSTIAQIIAAACGEEHCCIMNGGAILEEILRKNSHPTPQARTAQQQLWIQKKEELGDPEWLTKEIRRRFRECGKPVWIFTGLRKPWDVEFIKEYPSWLIFYVTPAEERRLVLARSAAMKDAGKTDEKQIKEADLGMLRECETEQDITAISRLDGVCHLYNTRTFRDLGAQVIAVLLTKRVVSPDEINSRKDALEALYQKLESQSTLIP